MTIQTLRDVVEYRGYTITTKVDEWGKYRAIVTFPNGRTITEGQGQDSHDAAIRFTKRRLRNWPRVSGKVTGVSDVR
jgi:hypothetical protein